MGRTGEESVREGEIRSRVYEEARWLECSGSAHEFSVHSTRRGVGRNVMGWDGKGLDKNSRA